jgi:hypothetical protein
MLGLFLGFVIAVATAWASGGSRRSDLPGGRIGALLLLAIGLMAADGINAALFDLRHAHLYVPHNGLRLATGLLCGVALAAFIAPVVSLVFWKRREAGPLFSTWAELGRAVVWTAVAGVTVGTGLLPAVLLGVVSVAVVIASFWLVSTYVAVLGWEGPGRAESWRDLGSVAVAGLVLTGAELMGMAAARAWLEATVGVAWVV